MPDGYSSPKWADSPEVTDPDRKRAWIESRGAVNVWDLFVWAGLNPKRISHDAPRKDRGDAPLYFLTYNRMTAWVTEADRDAILASQPIPAAGTERVTWMPF